MDAIHRKRGFDRGLGYDFVIDNGTNTRVDGQIEASPRWIKQMEGAHCDAAGFIHFRYESDGPFASTVVIFCLIDLLVSCIAVAEERTLSL